MCVLAGITHGAPGIYLRPVFEKSANGIFNKDKEVHFGFELNNRLRDPVEVKVEWRVTTDQKKLVLELAPFLIKFTADEKRVVSYPGYKDLTLDFSKKY